MSSWTDRLYGWTTSRLAFPVAIAAALIALVLSEGGYMTVKLLAEQRETALEARLAVTRLQRELLILESSERGYLLTGRPAYREPYDRTLGELLASINVVRALADRYEGQRQALTELAEVASRKVSEMREVMRLFDAHNGDAAVELMLTDIGRDQMEHIDELVEGVASEELASFDRTGRAHDRVLFWSRLGIAVLALMCLWAVFVAVRMGRDRHRQQVRHLAQLAVERDKLEAEVARRTAELTDLARHLQTVREDERSHLARELHDELGGLLTTAKLDVARVKKRVDLGVPELAERIRHLNQILDAGIALKRRIIENLRPSSLGNLGLQKTLEIHCAEFAQQGEVELRHEIGDVVLDEERSLAVFRLVQEALTNIAKYARARRVQVVLRRQGDLAEVRVEDDGIGFEPAAVRAGHGLAGMHFRVQGCGGRLVVRSGAGQGTTLVATLPIAAPAPQPETTAMPRS